MIIFASPGCGPGALSGAAGSFATPLVRTLRFEAQLIATSVVGGLASVAGGGKFANGALKAAFGYLFNGQFGRKLTGRGHHMPTNEAARKWDWSDAALAVFDSPLGEGGGRIEVQRHNFGDGHHEYNRNLNNFVTNYLKNTDIDPSQMTTDQAKQLISSIKQEPVLRAFNMKIYMKGIFRVFRSYPTSRTGD